MSKTKSKKQGQQVWVSLQTLYLEPEQRLDTYFMLFEALYFKNIEALKYTYVSLNPNMSLIRDQIKQLDDVGQKALLEELIDYLNELIYQHHDKLLQLLKSKSNLMNIKNHIHRTLQFSQTILSKDHVKVDTNYLTYQLVAKAGRMLLNYSMLFFDNWLYMNLLIDAPIKNLFLCFADKNKEQSNKKMIGHVRSLNKRIACIKQKYTGASVKEEVHQLMDGHVIEGNLCLLNTMAGWVLMEEQLCNTKGLTDDQLKQKSKKVLIDLNKLTVVGNLDQLMQALDWALEYSIQYLNDSRVWAMWSQWLSNQISQAGGMRVEQFEVALRYKYPQCYEQSVVGLGDIEKSIKSANATSPWLPLIKAYLKQCALNCQNQQALMKLLESVGELRNMNFMAHTLEGFDFQQHWPLICKELQSFWEHEQLVKALDIGCAGESSASKWMI